MQIDKTELAAQVKQTGANIIHTIAAFTGEQFNSTPSYGGWTAGQVAEHLLLSAGVAEVIAGRTSPTTDRQPDTHLAMIAGVFLDFSTKLPSPDYIIPAEGYYDKEEMLNKIKLVWDKIGEGTRLLDLSATCLDFEFPGVGPMTRLEWIWFYVWHTQRHLHQLKNIYASVSCAHADRSA
ncbi:DinB family protein [Puia dinghuensis]|uniref:DinB-like domain-containing protein n=1 Tax=Puia dinghuensis TaxID=1792502 RepID=A0A8J2UCF3_9BACT|nr:DinB family protein [Puia dinghuensis]GGA98556.1 hypothetical protein GCM10011511_22340 [Puia dinghuensis]